MSGIRAPTTFEVIRRAPSEHAAGLICGMTGYREMAAGRFYQREAAPLRLPLIISLGSPFLIALGRDPAPSDRQSSFAAGLHAGPVHIESDGTGGTARIAALAEEIGWSRKHLAGRFRSELGLAPKPLARMLRFHQACRLVRSGTASDWAGIAAESGYADQAHLAREFMVMAGESPTAWARRLALTDDRLMRPEDASADW